MTASLPPQSDRRSRAGRAIVALSLSATLAGCAAPPSLLGDEFKARLANPAGSARNAAADRARYITLDLPAATLQGGKLPPGARLVWNGTPLRVDAEGRVAVPERLLAAPGGFTLVIEGVGRARVRPEQLQGDRLTVSDAVIEVLTQEAASAIFRAADATAVASAVGTSGPAGASSAPAESQMPTAEQLRLPTLRLTDTIGLSASGHLGALAGLGQEAKGVVTFGQGGLTLSQLLNAPGAAVYDTRTGETSFQTVEGQPGPLPLEPSGRSSLELAMYGSTSGRGVIVGSNGGTLVSGSGGVASGSEGGGLVGPDAGGLISGSDTGLIGPDAGGLVGPGSLESQPGAGLVGLDGGTLTAKAGTRLNGPTGGALVGPDGGSLVADRVAGLIGPDGGSLLAERGAGLIADRGAGLIGPDGGSLLAERGAGLVGLDGGSLVNTGAAAMTGYPYFPAAGLAAAKHQLLSVGMLAAPVERVTGGGVREVLLPGKTRVRAVTLQGQRLTGWTQTGPSGAFQLRLPPAVPVIFMVLAEARVPGKPVQRASALAFSPGARERPVVVPIDSASTLITASTAFLADYLPREIARIESVLATLPDDGASYRLLDGDDRDEEDEDEDEDNEGDTQAPATTRTVAEKRLKTLKSAQQSFNPLYYGVDTALAYQHLDAAGAMALSKASSLEEAYNQLRKLVQEKRLAPESIKPVAPQSPLVITS